ncbi:S1C family serine protease [Actinomyces trachealis]|uniref:S1C family serine protease n=1 Tax=Actinomyces trachealis TaxID=2763540 RepID=UPI0018C661B7|nr:trypsin-like peptidase domain-containing protein [Actinomyces trachealis]
MSIYDETTGGPNPDDETSRTSSSWSDPRTYRPGPVSASAPEPPAPPAVPHPTPQQASGPERSFYPYAQEPPVAESTNGSSLSDSTYTSAPATPAGYSFERTAPALDTTGPASRPFTASVYEPSETPRSRANRRRGPGWGALVGATVVTALLASGGAAVVTRSLDRPANSAPAVSALPRPTQGGTTQPVDTTKAADWQAVSAAVGNSVVAITVSLNDGTSQGSGVIYDATGHIITNNHVVQGAKKIQVTLADGRIYEARLTGTDPATDLAVIELVNPPKDLVVATVGDSDALAIGQGVMAIGNPLGLSSTVTTGIISALNRPVVTTQEERNSEGQGGQQDLDGLGGLLGGLLGGEGRSTSQVVTNAIQVDAAINPGNSGGPLFDARGTVIGINSSIATASKSSNGSIGIGFAIPAKLAKKVADQIIANGKATHAYLGVTLKDTSVSAEGVTRVGAEVQTVEPGSPAEKAGLRPQDVLIAIDGKSTNQSAALTGFVRQYSSGDQATLTVIRGGKREEIQVTLAERADS